MKVKAIDIHCHVLPDLDDGSASIWESKDMIRMAFWQGVRSVIATPHYSSAFGNDDIDVIRSKCEDLETWAQKALSPDFCVYPGQEILCSHEAMERIKAGDVIPLAESDCILVEFQPSISYEQLLRQVRDITMSPYTPVIAHAERYVALWEEGRLREVRGTGALIQVNYGSISGDRRDEPTKWCRRALKEHMVQFVATDMHNMGRRAPKIEKAARWMRHHLDEEYVKDLCFRNAEHLLLKKGEGQEEPKEGDRDAEGCIGKE
ncbi:MAG: protein tyrosine phosphatase [Clostridiales bacterium]|nr:protein tyrosine phosphatase [Clostridiales bacterium]